MAIFIHLDYPPAWNNVTKKAQIQFHITAVELAAAFASGRNISALMVYGRGPTPKRKHAFLGKSKWYII